MADKSARVPIQGLVLLTIAMIVGPTLVTGSLVLMIDGRVPDFSRGTEIAQFAIALFFGLTVWGIGIRAYWRGGRGAANRAVGIIVKLQPAFWFLGVALGVAGAFGIIDSALANRANLAGFYCDDVMEREDAQWDRCLELALQCDDEADEGPCGDIASRADGDRCMTEYKQRRAELTDAQRGEAPAVQGGDYTDAMRAMCIVERLSAK